MNARQHRQPISLMQDLKLKIFFDRFISLISRILDWKCIRIIPKKQLFGENIPKDKYVLLRLSNWVVEQIAVRKN